ncbi:MAG: DNA topoisomerase 4 subunit A [Propionibacteriaceae bacterium]|jgi:DNA gyrase subunit A|nr:DNA topoisomerase 4 subunit A [Propionibacteriaceae bacterium]
MSTSEDEMRVIDVDVTAEMESGFLEYAYSVIYARALPDARDGLKPVQRRILFSMDDEGLRPDKSYVKCARVVGSVMGKLHPHGDSAIYDAMVRLGQWWTQRLTLIDGHGNFGSLDAGPAAMRYTECRMAPAALAMTAGLDEDAVDFRPNYDGKEMEPSVLPAAFPNLLVNGATGIAVGMATNIAPHNLGEVVGALRYLITNPDATLDELMRFVPGPDLPGGGKIIGLDGIREAYETGRGTFRIRATARIEQVSPRRRGIVITELPHMIGPERIIEQIKTLVQAKKIIGISDVKDLTDLDKGLHLVIEVKNGVNAEALLNELYRVTKLEDSFAVNAVALVDGQPRTLGLKEMLQVYLTHRLEVTLRRTQYQLEKATARLHLVEGLLLAIIDIDEVIAIIRSSEEVGQARNRLMEAYQLSLTQANYILDMQLRQLTKLSRIRLETEQDELAERIAGLQAIVDSPARLSDVVSNDLAEVAANFADPRRTILLEGSGAPAKVAGGAAALSTQLEIPDGPCQVLLSTTALLARVDTADPLPSDGPREGHDAIRALIATTTHSEFGLLTSTGRLIRYAAIDLPTIPLTATAPSLKGGSPVAELVSLESGENVIGLTPLDAESMLLAVGTKNGVVKRVAPELVTKDSWDIIRLDDGDSVVGAVSLARESDELVFITSDAQLLHFPATSVRPQGRAAGGMAGIKLAPGQSAIWFGAVAADASTDTDAPGHTHAVVVSVSGTSDALPGTQAGNVKVTPFSEYPGKGRATGGVRCHRFLKGEDVLLLGWVGAAPAVANAASGSPIDLPPDTGRRDGSGTPALQPIAGIASRSLVV